MEDMKRNLEKKIERLTKKIEQIRERHGDKPAETHTYHGGWTLGYWEGRLSALEDIQEQIKGLGGDEKKWETLMGENIRRFNK